MAAVITRTAARAVLTSSRVGRTFSTSAPASYYLPSCSAPRLAPSPLFRAPNRPISELVRKDWSGRRYASVEAAAVGSTTSEVVKDVAGGAAVEAEVTAAALPPADPTPVASTPAPAPAPTPEPLLSSVPEGTLPSVTDADLPASTFNAFISGANDTLISTGTLDLTPLIGSWAPHPILRLQSMFLQLHDSFPFLSTPLPWWSLIAAVTIFLRLLLFSFQVRAQANAARMAIIQPQMLSGMAKVKAAKEARDSVGAHMAQMEVQQLMSKNNVNPIRNLAFPLAQATVFMTMFFAIRGLSGSGVEGMATEGLGWVHDLSQRDEMWVLPVASTALTMATLELGVDSSTQVQTSTTKNMKLFFRVMLVVALPFIAYFPAAVLVYWCTNNSVSLAQSLFLKRPAVRKFFGILEIPKKIQPGEPGYIPEPSFAEAFRNVQTGMSDKWEETKAKGEAEASRRQAFELGTPLPPKGYKAEVYLPRAPLKKKASAIEKATVDLGMAPDTNKGVIRAQKLETTAPAPREMGAEEEKMRRLLAARQRRKKN